MSELRIFSDGIGVNSVAALVLAAQGVIQFDAFVFANVGEDSEHPASLAYRREYVEPFAAKHGINLIERWRTIHGERVTLKEYTLSDNKSLPIPLVFPGKGYGNRSCTRDWKVEVIDRWIRGESGADRIVMGIGFTTNEGARVFKRFPGWHDHYMRKLPDGTWKEGAALGYERLYEYPLILQGMNRAACYKLIEAAGLPKPPRSACWFCPFKSREAWIEEKRNGDPAFADSVVFQDQVNEKYRRVHTDNPKMTDSPFVSLHRDGIRLEDVPDQMGLWDQYMDTDEDGCTTGVCDV